MAAERLVGLLLAAAVLAGCTTTGEAADAGWDRAAIGAPGFAGPDGDGIVVALLDGRVDVDHPVFAHMDGPAPGHYGLDRLAVRDFLASPDGDPPLTPVSDHATAIAGIIAGQSDDWGGLAPGVTLYNAVVCTADHCDVQAIKRALEDVQRFADVVSISISNPPDGSLDGLFDDRIAEMVDDGILVIASVGNRGPDGQANGLAAIREVISVGSAGPDGVSSFSSRGRSIPCADPRPCIVAQAPFIVAPGEGVRAPAAGGGQETFEGTSFAVPYVTAAAALVFDDLPEGAQRTETFRAWLADGAEPLRGQTEPHDAAAGYGMLRIDALLGPHPAG